MECSLKFEADQSVPRFPQDEIQGKRGDCLSFVVRSCVRQVCAPSPIRFNFIIDWSLDQALHDYPGVLVLVYDLVSADHTVILSSSYREVQDLLGAVNHHSTTSGMRIIASKIKVMLAFIPGKKHQATLFDGEPLEDNDKFKYLGSMFVQNSRGS